MGVVAASLKEGIGVAVSIDTCVSSTGLDKTLLSRRGDTFAMFEAAARIIGGRMLC
jgi:hypothetical protein